VHYLHRPVGGSKATGPFNVKEKKKKEAAAVQESASSIFWESTKAPAI